MGRADKHRLRVARNITADIIRNMRKAERVLAAAMESQDDFDTEQDWFLHVAATQAEYGMVCRMYFEAKARLKRAESPHGFDTSNVDRILSSFFNSKGA